MKPSNPPFLGAAYYPEDWPLEQIDEDIRIMLDAGMNIMRIGEFAWSRMEPEEGRYDFDWLHLVVDKLGAAGISVIMGTPTCTPPAWLTEKYPEILFVRDDFGRAMHGSRRHACPNSPVYRDLCTGIVTKMAEEFGTDERIIGWQIDNEVHPYGGRSCVCPVCVSKFRAKMREKFGTIEALNAAWGTDLWSMTYQSFDQLPIPDRHTWHHPSLLTAWAEFNSDSYAEFVAHQADILHRMTIHPIGTDMMPTPGVDYGDIHHSLDVVQFNHYNSADNLWQAAFWFDFCRPIKEQPFWNTETQTCWNGSVTANGYKEPGFCRANSWLPFALGGEANLYWLWRQHWSGQELLHGAVISSSGRPLHIFGEVQEISRGLRASADFLNSTRPAKTGLGLHYSHRAAWMFEYQPHVNGFNYTQAVLNRVYRPMTQIHLRPDVLLPLADLSGYRVIVSPFLISLDEFGLRERIKAWVEGGGTCVVGPLSDIRTQHATKYTHAPYGSLEEWAGVRSRYEVPGDPREFGVRWADGRESIGSLWYDGLELRGAKALATYTEYPFEGLAAVTEHRVGKGRIIVLGTMPQPEDMQSLLASICAESGVSPAAEASDNLVVVRREGDAGDGLAVVEVENRAGALTLPEPMTDLITGTRYQGTIDVPPYGVLMLRS